MKIGIIGAMAQEVEILRNLMVEPKITELAGCKIFEGKLTIRVLRYYNQALVKYRLPSAQHYLFSSRNLI